MGTANTELIAWQCPKCGTVGRAPFNVPRIICCGQRYPLAEVVIAPSLPALALNLSRDTVRHVFAGSKLVDDETRAFRLAQCEACPLFHKTKRICTHQKCGCRMLTERGWLDALGWASKRCPIGRWEREEKNASTPS